MALLKGLAAHKSQYIPQLQLIDYPYIDLEYFSLGIDNIHIDAKLSSIFSKHANGLIIDLLNERSSSKKRFTDKPSDKVRKELEIFTQNYTDIMSTAMLRAKASNNIAKMQLLQLAILKFLQQSVASNLEQILHDLRATSLSGNQSANSLANYDRSKWIQQNKNSLLIQVISELFAQANWAEKHQLLKLRQELFGLNWFIPEAMNFNLLIYTGYDDNLLLDKYIWLSDDALNPLYFRQLQLQLDEFLADLIANYPVKIIATDQDYPKITNDYFTVGDNPENILQLFAVSATAKQLELHDDAELAAKLDYQQNACKLLIQYCKKYNLYLPILASYELPRLYKYYYHLIEPKTLFAFLCGEVNINFVQNKLQQLLKLKVTRKNDNPPPNTNELLATQKRLRQAVKQEQMEIITNFMFAFARYRLDLKLRQLLMDKLKRINLLDNEEQIQLSRSNGILNEFLLSSEYNGQDEDSIRGHVIIKADLRGSTTIVTELRKRGLNPATHFSLHFFDPIRALIKDFGAEKVFIEGDAIILSIFEYQSKPEQWFAVARACGLAHSIINIVAKQNQVCLEEDLPGLELGIGICYEENSPDFLYDEQQRIMISSAIGCADRLSSCSWQLRQTYQHKQLPVQVLVFQHPSQNDKGMTTARYNLNGIELNSAAFNKLSHEIALKTISLKLPGLGKNEFFTGQYRDLRGQSYMLVVRRARIHSQSKTISKDFYYEVITQAGLLQTILSAAQR